MVLPAPEGAVRHTGRAPAVKLTSRSTSCLLYPSKLRAELTDTMAMCGAHSLAEIRRSMLFGY